MAMKIDNSTKSLTGNASLEDSGRFARRPPEESAAPPISAQVQLSPLSAQLQSIHRGFADTPVIDAARVAELKSAIASGHFTINADKIADRLLETVRELIDTHQRRS
jgi:negative regulator of flagellin synthesis FlgM